MADVTKLLNGLKQAVDAIETMLPVAKALGLPDIVSKVSGVVSSAVDVALNIKQRYEEGKVVLSGEDEQQIDEIIARLQAQNDELAKAIADS